MDAAMPIRSTLVQQPTAGELMTGIVAELVRKTRAEQGLPARVSDPVVINRLATLIQHHPNEGKTNDR
jgi:hypothetical protein